MTTGYPERDLRLSQLTRGLVTMTYTIVVNGICHCFPTRGALQAFLTELAAW